MIIHHKDRTTDLYSIIADQPELTLHIESTAPLMSFALYGEEGWQMQENVSDTSNVTFSNLISGSEYTLGITGQIRTGRIADFDLGGNGAFDYQFVSAVPEPSTVVMMIGALVLALATRWRKAK